MRKNTYTWKREDIFTRQGKILSRKFKETYIGLTETQARAKLEEDKATHNIYAIDVYRSYKNYCQVIYINFGMMALHFDKRTRKVVRIS